MKWFKSGKVYSCYHRWLSSYLQHLNNKTCKYKIRELVSAVKQRKRMWNLCIQLLSNITSCLPYMDTLLSICVNFVNCGIYFLIIIFIWLTWWFMIVFPYKDIRTTFHSTIDRLQNNTEVWSSFTLLCCAHKLLIKWAPKF